MTFFDVFFYLSLFGGFLMAFSLGANDVANSMASAVGAKAITVRQALLIASVMNLLGAVYLGSHVTATISKGIISADTLADPRVLTLGMFSTLLTAGLWVLLSTLTGLPVSSTHSVIGGLIGFGLVAAGPEAVHWAKLQEVLLSWILTPVMAGIVAAGIYGGIKYTLVKTNDMDQSIRKWCPVWLAGASGLIIVTVILEFNPAAKILDDWFLICLVVIFFVLFMWEMGKNLIREYLATLEDKPEAVEKIFRILQVFTSAYVSLAHGANDVANAFGPVTAIYLISKYHHLPEQGVVPPMMLVLGGVGIAVGISALGNRVMKTVGEDITKLNHKRGFAVDFSVASTVLVASRLGLPVSSTTVAVGAISGVGLAQGTTSVQYRTLVRIVLMWLITVPFAALTCAIVFLLLTAIVM